MSEHRLETQIKLLLVEDDVDFSKSLSIRLNRKNINLTAIDNAEKALQLLSNNNYNVIITDIRLNNGMNGIDFLEKVKEINGHLPVILLTGYADLKTAKEAVKLHAFDYLIKPVENIDNLLTPINNAVKNYNLIKENIFLKEYYKSIFENIPIGIVTINQENCIDNANRAFYKIFNLYGDTVIGKSSNFIDNLISNKIYDANDKNRNNYYCTLNNNNNIIYSIFLNKLNINNKSTIMVISEVDINFLSNREKEVFFKLFMQQSEAEIARSLDIDINTVYVYKNRLKIKLKDRVDIIF